MNVRDIAALSDQKLIRAAIMSLAFGALPVEDWAQTFASTAEEEPEATEDLRNLAFIIWFPTTTDYMLTAGLRTLVRGEAEKRGLACESIFASADELSDHFHNILSLLTREEQIFVRDRRWQSIYGNLDYFVSPTPTVRWYDSVQRRVETAQIANEDLQDVILAPFYADQSRSESRLRSKVVKSREWSALSRLHRASLTTKHLLALMKQFNVK